MSRGYQIKYKGETFSQYLLIDSYFLMSNFITFRYLNWFFNDFRLFQLRSKMARRLERIASVVVPGHHL